MYIQIYTGQGKGKTTAAFGLVIRALGRGLKVCIFQFLKCGDSGEVLFLKENYPDLQITCAGLKGFYTFLDSREKALAKEIITDLFIEANKAVCSGSYDLVVMDELLGVLENDILSLADVIRMLDQKSEGTELVITGRVLPVEVAERAGLITDMRCIKHYYEEGRSLEKGIEY